MGVGVDVGVGVGVGVAVDVGVGVGVAAQAFPASANDDIEPFTLAPSVSLNGPTVPPVPDVYPEPAPNPPDVEATALIVVKLPLIVIVEVLRKSLIPRNKSVAAVDTDGIVCVVLVTCALEP